MLARTVTLTLVFLVSSLALTTLVTSSRVPPEPETPGRNTAKMTADKSFNVSAGRTDDNGSDNNNNNNNNNMMMNNKDVQNDSPAASLVAKPKKGSNSSRRSRGRASTRGRDSKKGVEASSSSSSLLSLSSSSSSSESSAPSDSETGRSVRRSMPKVAKGGEKQDDGVKRTLEPKRGRENVPLGNGEGDRTFGNTSSLAMNDAAGVYPSHHRASGGKGGTHLKEDKRRPTFWSEDIQVGCRELRARRYITDGFCTSEKPIKEVVCAGHCLPIMDMPWYAEFVKTVARSKLRDWQCVEDDVRKKKVKLVCQNGSLRFYRIKVVKSCKCKKITSRHNRTEFKNKKNKKRRRRRRGRQHKAGKGS